MSQAAADVTIPLVRGFARWGMFEDGMQTFYQMPFEPFERYSPYGTPAEVAEFIRPYVEAGCSAFNVIPCAENVETAIEAVGEMRRLLTRP